KHCVFEKLAIFGKFDALENRADEFDVVAFECAVFSQRFRQIQRGLPTDGGQQRVRLLLLNNALANFGRQWLDIGGVGKLRVSHDGGGVGVDKDNAVAFAPQHLTCLHAAVIEFAALPDNDGTRAKDQDGFDVSSFWHDSPLKVAAILLISAKTRDATASAEKLRQLPPTFLPFLPSRTGVVGKVRFSLP